MAKNNDMTEAYRIQIGMQLQMTICDSELP